MQTNNRHWQWNLILSVYHGPGFGHVLELGTQSRGRKLLLTDIGQWNSLGIPESVLTQARSTVDAAMTEHLVTRYGVQGELPTLWAGEPDPF